MAKYLVHDIETIPETEIQHMWVAEKKKLEEAGNTRDTKFEPVWAHKVICIGMLVLDAELKPVQGGLAAGGLAAGKGEKEMIERWSEIASGKRHNLPEPMRLVDWHGARFDVPVIQTRAFRHGIQLPWLYGLQPDNRGGFSQWSKDYRDRYAGKHDDLSELWTNRGQFPKPHLANLSELMGLPGKFGLDGSKVYETWKEFAHCQHVADGKQPGPPGTPEQIDAWRKKGLEIAATIDRYCMQDVIQTAFVMQRFWYMQAKLTLDQYRAAAVALMDWTGKQPEQLEFLAAVDRAAVLME